MGLTIYLNLAIIAVSAAGLIYGLKRYWGRHKPLYALMIVLGVGCIMISSVYTFVRALTGLEVFGVFHAGMLGNIGVFAFFFSSNFGQIDSLVDDGGSTFMKYRIIALAGCAAVLAIYAAIVFSPARTAEKVMDGITAAAIAAASYFHLKHLMIPDVDYGVVNCLRLFNALALVYGLTCMMGLTAVAYGSDVLYIISAAAQCIFAGLLVPAMDMGVRKWSR